jgi:cell division protein FtsL
MTAQPAPVTSFDLVELASPQRMRGQLRPWVVFAVVVVIAFFALILSRVWLDRSGFDLDALEQEIAIEEARLRDLRVEVARLQDPDRITAVAIANGLVYPEQRIAIEVPGIEGDQLDPEFRWAQLKVVLTAQP